MTNNVQLSVVAASRNDNHGGNLIERMQYFVTGFVEQCKRHSLSAELILVDWNPPEDTPPLKEALTFPEFLGPCTIRIITVPKTAHQNLDHSDHLPLFQMIAKNIGISRAKGKFILATNIDIIFSDPLMEYLKLQLKPGFLYRTHRYDVPSELPPLSQFDSLLDYCHNHHFRRHVQKGSMGIREGQWGFFDTQSSHHKGKLSFWISKIKSLPFTHPKFLVQKILHRLTFKNAYTNASGDFTLLSKEDWFDLRGYWEINGFSWHLDSLLLYQALKKEIKQVVLPDDCPIYHIEHEKGSGFTPETPKLVFQRIKKKKIPIVDDQTLIKKIAQLKKPYLYNEREWGMQEFTFEESMLKTEIPR